MNGFSILDNPNHRGNTDTWLTPLPLIKSLGSFDLDPCGYFDHPTANRLILLPEDGLRSKWTGRVWLNPPYGKFTGLWIDRLHKHGNGIALIFARTETKWFQGSDADAYLFLAGRIRFLRPDKTLGHNAGHGSVLLAYGKCNVETLRGSNLKGKFYSHNT